MAKLRNLSELQQSIAFTEFDFYQHYGLRKVAARIKSTEKLLIFFGIHTANVVRLARREAEKLAKDA